MTVDDVELLGNGDLFFSFRQVKGRGGHLLPDDYVWPARSCPDLLELMAVWLRFRTLGWRGKCLGAPTRTPQVFHCVAVAVVDGVVVIVDVVS